MTTDALARALDRASGARPIPGNAIRLLDAPGALTAMLEAISTARHSVNFENYIIKADATGRRFAEALEHAAARGVTVRVLYDPVGCRTTPLRFWRRLRRGGCAVRTANALSLAHPLRAFQRDHRKLITVDGSIGILGGVCIADPWMTGGRLDDGPWRDAAIEVRGPAVGVMFASFTHLWRQSGGEGDATVTERDERPGDAVVRVIEGAPGALRLQRALEFLAATATRQLWITDAYFVAPPSMMRALIAAAQDGVDVRLMVPGQSDLPIVRSFTRVGYRELLRAGARIWEWHGPMLHSKTALVDGHRFKVGSSNLNPSSLMGNWELDVMVDDVALATEAANVFRRDLNQAVEIVLRMPRLVPALPPAVVSAARQPRLPPARELPRRAFRTLRHVAGGARRGLAGALTFSLAGIGALLVALPTTVAYLLAAAAFGLAGLAAVRALGRRRD